MIVGKALEKLNQREQAGPGDLGGVGQGVAEMRGTNSGMNPASSPQPPTLRGPWGQGSVSQRGPATCGVWGLGQGPFAPQALPPETL